MQIVQLKIDNSIYHNVMFLLNNLKLKGLEIQEDKVVVSDIISNHNEWSEEELTNISKIGFNSKSFADDIEDYSKW